MLKKISAIILSLVVLMMNMGFTYSIHYCGGKAVKTSLSLTRSELSCGMTKNESTTKCTAEFTAPTISKKGCCENEHFTFQMEEEFQSFNFYLHHWKENPEVMMLPSIPILPNSISLDKIFFISYPPPQIKKEISLLFQVFRI